MSETGTVTSIRDNSTLFDAYIRRSPRSTQVLDAEGRTLAVNPAWEALWGASLDDLAQYNIRRDPQLEAAGTAQLLERAFAGETVELPAIRYVPDRGPTAGESRWVRGNATPILDTKGDVERVILVHEDMTEMFAAQERLERTRELLEESQRSAHVGSWSWDLASSTVEWSAETYAIYGADPSTPITYERFMMLVHPDDRVVLGECIGQALVSRGTFDINHRIVRLDTGEERVLHARGRAVLDPDGEPIRMVGSGQDVTERLAAEQALRASEARLRTAVSIETVGVLFFTLAGRILDANDAFCRMVGYSREELLHTTHWEMLTPPEFLAITERAARELEWSGKTAPFEKQLVRKDGSRVWGLFAPTRLSDGGPDSECVEFVVDISDRKRMEWERETFVQAAAHDLRTPLSAIKMQAQVLARRIRRGAETEPERVVTGLTEIARSADRMVSLIDEMLDVAHLHADRALQLNPVTTDLVTLAQAAVDDAQRSSHLHSVRFEAELESLVGEWDEARLARVLGNLLGNAIKYSPRSGEVVVRVERAEEADAAWAVVQVIDNGVGIPEEDLPHIFERYRRGSNVGGRIAGAGIGLAGARQIVEQHGGAISVESEEGRGSVFTVHLPLQQQGETGT